MRLRSIVNRILLEGNTNVVRLPEGELDPDQHGDRVIDFARFVVESGFRFSPLMRVMVPLMRDCNVRCSNYKFSWRGKREAIQVMTWEVSPGTMVAPVGSCGATIGVVE